MAAYTLPEPATGSVQNNGVLEKWIKQTVDNTPAEDSQGILTYKEKWKGPYQTLGKTILSRIAVGNELTVVHLMMGTHVEEFSAPTCPQRGGTNGKWILKNISVELLPAGDHCYLNLDFEANYEAEATDIEKLNVWSISWMSYSVSPWEFCSNSGTLPSPWSPTYDLQPPQPNWNKKADRALIESALDHNPEFKNGHFIVSTPDKSLPDVREYLDAASYELWKKVALDRNAIYHYPVITHLTATSYDLSATYTEGALGDDIDHEVTLSGCPYQFPANTWTFIKTGDNMTQTKDPVKNKTIYVRLEQFQGVLKDSFDINYYGNGTFSHDEAGILSGRWERASI